MSRGVDVSARPVERRKREKEGFTKHERGFIEAKYMCAKLHRKTRWRIMRERERDRERKAREKLDEHAKRRGTDKAKRNSMNSRKFLLVPCATRAYWVEVDSTSTSRKQGTRGHGPKCLILLPAATYNVCSLEISQVLFSRPTFDISKDFLRFITSVTRDVSFERTTDRRMEK